MLEFLLTNKTLICNLKRSRRRGAKRYSWISGIARDRAGLSEALGAIGKEDILIVWNLTRKWGCGAVKVSCEEYVIGGYIGDWLMITGWAKRWVLERFQKQGKVPPICEDFFRLLVEKNVRLQVKHLAMLSMLRGQWATTPGIHGRVYDIATDLITDLAKADATLADTCKD